MNQEVPGSIGRIGVSGSDQQLDWQADQKGAELVVTDGDDVFWTRPEDGVFRRNRTTNVVSTVLAARVLHGGIAVDADNVYLTSQSEGRVVRVDRKSGAALDVATQLEDPIGITQDATAIYFAAHKSGTIYRMVK